MFQIGQSGSDAKGRILRVNGTSSKLQQLRHFARPPPKPDLSRTSPQWPPDDHHGWRPVDTSDLLETVAVDDHRTCRIRPHPSYRARCPLDGGAALDFAFRAWFRSCCRARPVCPPHDGERVGYGGECGRDSFWSVSRRHRRSARKVSGPTWIGSWLV